MALPKKNKKNINITPSPVQGHYPEGYSGIITPNRREELSDLIDEHGTMLPKSVLHADLDRGMLDFVQDDLRTSVSGKKIPVIDRILTLQRWGEFSKTWSFSDKDKNVSLPFIVVVRKPDVQPGTNPSLQYTIPDRKQFHYAKVPTYEFTMMGFLIDEDEFEVSPAVSRVVTLLGGEGRSSKDNSEVSLKSKWEYDPASTSVTRTYVTKVDLKTIRTSNVDISGVTISIDTGNGVFIPINYPTLPAMVNPNDLVKVEIIKVNPINPAWIMFQETIVR